MTVLDAIANYLCCIVENLDSDIVSIDCISSDVGIDLQVRRDRSTFAEAEPVIGYLRL